ITPENADAGEDIRYVPRHLAGELPADDWWLYDDSLVAFNVVDTNGSGVGGVTTDDPQIVAYCRSIRDRLWRLATPYAEFAHATL
ncbi:DUF6879 family protein, partial [Nocardia pseudovaccinii]|uniref:DUF6879 family protein n=1 Tax=Nocardia pseudovaccinii TaxID=189540 RepID=UPI000B14E785